MKLISLNTWGGILAHELKNFIVEQSNDTDIFCFQEVFHKAINVRKELGGVDIYLFDTLSALLPHHTGYYAASQDDDEGLAIFVKPEIAVDEVSDVFVHRSRNAMINNDGRTLGRNIQYLLFHVGDQIYTVINFHGLWNGSGKADSPDRVAQSQKIRQFIDTQANGKVILIGDFNLEPNTESVAILETGMRNLISDYGITSTRSYHYTKPVKFADYAIVSNDLLVDDFSVIQDPVSDHLPLLLKFH